MDSGVPKEPCIRWGPRSPTGVGAVLGGMSCTPAPLYSNTHTHTHLTALCPDYPLSRYQKGKINLDFTKARDSEWQWQQLGHTQVCTSLQADNHASTLPLSFYRPDAFPAAQPTASMHWRHMQTLRWAAEKWLTWSTCGLGWRFEWAKRPHIKWGARSPGKDNFRGCSPIENAL